MEILTLISLYWAHIVAAVVTYWITVAFYRTTLHPLARFPGPRLAAITRFYEAYYDVVCNGSYTFKIAELHEKYGPIIRISPYELHINDPAYFEKLYGHDGRWNKYGWAYDAFAAQSSTICSVDHDMHRQRREPLNPFFSKSNVSRKQNIIQRLTDKLSDRLRGFAGLDTIVNLTAALSALARDVGAEFILGKKYNNLDVADFNAGMTGVFQSGGKVWILTKHVRWFGPLMKSLPLDFVEKMGDQGTKEFFAFIKDMLKICRDAVSALSSKSAYVDKPRSAESASSENLVDCILDSNLPPAEKTVTRMHDELGTVTGAAFETTANSLRFILYHVYSTPNILNHLRTEVSSAKQLAGVSKVSDMSISSLEQLPYLTAVLMEGLRFTPGIATRMARIAPDRPLVYGDLQIPAGTPVGMTTFLMHMDASIYPDPKQFNPDRWVDKDARKKASKTFAPFSKGSRICLGMHLAWAELYMVLAALVDQFNFKFDNAGPKDVECVSDQFIVGVADMSCIKAWVTEVAA